MTGNDSRDELYRIGMEERRAVLGDDVADSVIAASEGFTAPLQRLVTEYCWGAVWARPGLPRRTRCLVNIGLLTALDRPTELATHIRGAMRSGCTREEIIEVLLQATVYCGVPAGVGAFRVADNIFVDASTTQTVNDSA
jgi:4-carboxymuconolactone decarboxylase